MEWVDVIVVLRVLVFVDMKNFRGSSFSGISSTSDLMKGKDAGYTHMKFFPAEASGGVKAIKSISGPFPDVTFCPTGGIGPDNYNDYLALNNVKCVGGSWLAPDDAIESGDWARITQLAKEAVAGAKQ